MTEIRALTIRQPYAGAIFAATNPKDVENRGRTIAWRGPLMIHAGQNLHSDPWAGRDVERITEQPVPIGDPSAGPEWTFGAVIGVVEVVGSHYVTECRKSCSPWAQASSHHIQLANPRKLTRPVPAYGRQSLWIPDEGLVAEVRRRLGAAA